MSAVRVTGCLGLAATLLACSQGVAAEDTIADPTATAVLPMHELPPEPPPGIWTRETLLGGEWRDKIEDHGLKLSPSFNLIFLGNPSGGMSQGNTVNGLFNLQLDLDFEKLTRGRVEGLIFHVNALYAFGPDISRKFIGDFSGVSPIATYNSIRLQELWLEKSFFNERLFVRAGNLAVDNDFFLSSSSVLYLNSMINTLITPMAINVPNFPAYPVASPGVRVKIFPTPRIYAMAGLYGMDVNSNPATNNKNGTRIALAPGSGMLIMSEVGYLLNQEPDDKGLHGTYRVGSFVHTPNYDTWLSQAQNATSSGPLRSASPNFGVYALFEQQIYARGVQSISIFAGGGGTPADINFLTCSFQCGMNFSGFLFGREHDIAGIAFARGSVSGDFSDASVSLGGAAYSVQSNIEATYRIQVTPWWYVQPDVQYIINPGATSNIKNAFVLGLSTGIAF